MNFEIEPRTLLKVKHGSHAYGLATETSDLDVKGICIEPKEYHFGFAKNFEQHIQEASKGYPQDLVIYSFKKFAKLAVECNPSIIEVLFVNDEDVLFCNNYGAEIRDFRQNFLSSKAKGSFLGFGHSQLKRIKSHREWLRHPPAEPPTRKEFGLPDNIGVTKAELGAFEALVERGMCDALSKEAIVLYTREKAYKNKKMEWDQYTNWQKSRNPVRAEMEAKFGFDGKFGLHMIRLYRTCQELLETGQLNVKRTVDRENLLSIRRGAWSYEKLIEEAERLEAKCEELYKTSMVLPKSPDVNKIDKFVVDLTERYLNEHG
jgi:predicted nucleotidyltransferase